MTPAVCTSRPAQQRVTAMAAVRVHPGLRALYNVESRCILTIAHSRIGAYDKRSLEASRTIRLNVKRWESRTDKQHCGCGLAGQGVHADNVGDAVPFAMLYMSLGIQRRCDLRAVLEFLRDVPRYVLKELQEHRSSSQVRIIVG